MIRTASNMQKLIKRHFYATSEDAYEKLDAFLMANRVSIEEYTDLSLLIEEVYNPAPAEEAPAEEIPVEETPAEEPVTEPSADEPVSE